MGEHCWAIAGSQGCAMQCVRCGLEVVHPVLTGDPGNEEMWDRYVDGECPSPCPDDCMWRGSDCE